MDEDTKKLYELADMHKSINDPEVAQTGIKQNRCFEKKLVPGIEVIAEEKEDGVDVRIIVAKDTVIKKPVHLCFGLTEKTMVQRINSQIEIGAGAQVSFVSYCVFPNAVDVSHIMEAQIHVGKNARYTYIERHIHSEEGGIRVYPKAKVVLEENARFKSDFELLRGRVGLIDMDYETTCKKGSTLEMTAKISGKGDDRIRIKEIAHLIGEHSTGVLTSRIAVREHATAEVYNEVNANAAYARGHVDCKEIIQDDGVVRAVPIVQASHPKARITHEASLGSVDKKQLETLMSRGLSEDNAVDLIIEGLLS